MKFVLLVGFVAFLYADVKSVPVEQDVRREDLLTKCLVQILSKALYKTDTTPLYPECNNIFKKGSDHFTDVELAHKGGKRPVGETKVKEEQTFEDLEKREEMHEERSQEEFPSFIKRRIRENLDEPNEERSQEEFPSFIKRRIREILDDPDDERSQEEFPSFVKRRIRENLDEPDDERSQEEFPSFIKRRIREKLDEQEDERSQEDFPTVYKRSSKHKKDTEDDRSQEEFPQKRHDSFYHQKRDNPDEERSQEEFPSYQYKRSRFLTGKDKREDPEYDRSQEDFPSYSHKRNYEEEDDEEEDREKRIWKPSHRYHHKKKHHKRSEDDEDYDRSQEEFPTYTHKRNSGTSEGSEEMNEEKRYWKPTHRYHHKKKLHKRADSEELENEEEPITDATKHRSPEEEVEEIIQELRDKKHPSTGQEEDEEQEREDALKYLANKKEIEERLNNGEVYDKRSPWIYRGYYHPAWYKRSQESERHPPSTLEELAETLRHKRGLVSVESHDQKLLTPDETELENLASVDQQMKEKQA